MSHHSTAAAACGGFAAERRTTATALQHGAAAANAGSVTLTAKMTRLNTDLLRPYWRLNF